MAFQVSCVKNITKLSAHVYIRHSPKPTLIPPTLTEAVITVIHKKGKDPEEVGSICHISLLNQGGKLSSKILANRLSLFLDKLVHPDHLYQVEIPFSI